MATNSANITKKDGQNPLTTSYPIETIARSEVPCNLQEPFEILANFKRRVKRLSNYEPHGPRELELVEACSEDKNGSASCQVLSAQRIMSMAQRSRSLNKVGLLTLMNTENSRRSLSQENVKHLHLVSCLFDAADKFSYHDYDQAESLLASIPSASIAGHPIERVVTYFASDLRERIEISKGKFDLEREVVHVDAEEATINLQAAIHTCEQKLPFTQITHFTVIQTILDSVAVTSYKRIHFIDVGIKLGSHWIVMMHALANRQNYLLEQLTITTVCTARDKIEETGKLLFSFAESMCLPFKFKVVNSEMNKLKKEMFELEAGELVAVYMDLCMTSLSNCPEILEALMQVIKNLNPYIMVVIEMEANTSASTFIDRFHDALFICGAMFDSQDACLERDDSLRKIIEHIYFQEIIKNRLMAENEAVFKTNLKIDFWREYFSRFGIVETELSQLSMYQASLLVEESASWKSCTLSMNQKSMLIGWDGTPLRSVSAWKFQHTEKKMSIC